MKNTFPVMSVVLLLSLCSPVRVSAQHRIAGTNQTDYAFGHAGVLTAWLTNGLINSFQLISNINVRFQIRNTVPDQLQVVLGHWDGSDWHRVELTRPGRATSGDLLETHLNLSGWQHSSQEDLSDELWALEVISPVPIFGQSMDFFEIWTDDSGTPDLVPTAPPGWSGPLVISTVPGNNSSAASFNTANTLYVDWAVSNTGNQPTATGFRTALYINDQLTAAWTVPPLMQPLTAHAFVDAQIGPLPAGTYDVTLVVDSTNAIFEFGDESNNTAFKRITVTGGPIPNLTPYKPGPWSDKIVVSRAPGDTTDSTDLTTGDSLYIDWAVANLGTGAATNIARIELYVDDVFRAAWDTHTPFNAGSYTFVPDYALGSLSVGTHQLRIRVDVTNTVFESNENDNEYTKTITIAVAEGTLQIFPLTTNVLAHATVNFSATGGQTPYTFTLATNNSSGSITSNGVYTAGNMPGIDTVRVTDASNTIALAVLTVGTLVPGTASPYLAGLPDGTQSSLGAPQPPDVAPAQSPVLVPGLAWPMPPDNALSFRAIGGVLHYYPHIPNPLHPPDGATFFSLDLGPVVPHLSGAEHGISDVQAPIDSLVGVFLGPDAPDTTPAPPALDFSTVVSRDYLLLRPLLKQVFFIGDGLTSGGVGQLVVPPIGATRLYLATMDNYGWSNNFGSFTVTANVSNLPAALTIYSPTPGIGNGGRVTFSAAGGTPPYTFSLAASNSGGGITPQGAYFAGHFSGSDTVRVTDSSNEIAEATIAVSLVPKFINIGRNPVGFVTSNAPGSFTIIGGGVDIWDNVDEFTFWHEELTGDFDVRVRVESLSSNARWSKAGIMVRESLAEDSRMAFIRVTPDPGPTCATNTGNGANDIRFGYRTGYHEPAGIAGDDHNGGRHEDFDAGNPVLAPPYPNAWLRLVRAGSVFMSYSSSNGVNWHTVASQNTTAWNGGAMKPTALLGLAVSALPSGSLCGTATAEFRDYEVRLGSTGAFRVAGADSRGNPNGVRVEFSQPVVFTGATFTLNNGGVVNSAAPGSHPSTVQLNTSALTDGVLYTVTVSGAISTNGEALASFTATFRHGAGYEQRRIHLSHNMIPGPPLQLYRGSTAYRLGLPVACQNRPATESVSLFEDVVPNTDFNENFSTRITGVLNINTPGNYRFACSSDDHSILFLSTDDNPAHKVQIAREPDWNGVNRAFASCLRRTCVSGVPQENQKTMHLEPGRYFMEHIASEGAYFNNASVTWDAGTGATIVNGQSPLNESQFVPSRFAFGEIFYTLGPVSIIRQPQPVSVSPGARVTFTVGVDGTPPYTFQWFKNGLPLSGATSRDSTFFDVQPADAGNYTVVIANDYGSVTSAVAVLTAGLPLTISPVSTNLSAGSTVIFAASGGTSPYTFDFATNSSGGSITTNGAYTAGDTPATDTVRVTDGANNTATAIITVTAISCATPPTGLTAWWPGGNNALDSSGTSHGTLHGTVTPGTGRVGSSWEFDGAEDYVEFPDGVGNFRTNDFSIECWFKSSAVGVGHLVTKRDALCGFGNFIDLDFAANGYLWFHIDAGSEASYSYVYSAQPLNDGVFHHAVVTRSGTDVRLFIDGSLAGSTTTPGVLDINNADPLRVGKSPCGGYNGLVDELSLYSRALNGAEVAALFAAGSEGKCVDNPCPPPSPGLIAWWRGEDNAQDTGGNNHGTLMNGVTFAPGRVGTAFNFDGIDDFVSVPDSASLTTPTAITIEAWINVVATNDVASVVSKHNGDDGPKSWGLAVMPAGALRFVVYDANQTTLRYKDTATEIIHPGIATHVAATFDTVSQEIKLYVNGVEQVSAIGPGSGTVNSIADTPTPVCLGTIQILSGQLFYLFHGTIDEVSIHNRALSAVEIATQAQCVPVPPLAISPTTTTISTNGTITFTASGGVPPYTYSQVTINSGGSITSNGVYTAGNIPSIDSVRVTDFASNSVHATVRVIIATPRITATIGVVGNELTLTWPGQTNDFILESTTTLSPPSWLPVPELQEETADGVIMHVVRTGTERYFRLRLR